MPRFSNKSKQYCGFNIKNLPNSVVSISEILYKYEYHPCPRIPGELGRYIAFLSRRLCFSSVKQYLNAVRLVHLEAGFQNPLEKNWYVSSILKWVRRLKGDASVQKLPITLDILKKLFVLLD